MEERAVAPADGERTKGKEEAVAETEKSFLERLALLITSLRSVSGFSDHPGLSNFKTVVDTTSKRQGVQRENLENVLVKIFTDFYDQHSKEILKGHLDFLKESKTVLVCGSSGKATIPLSEIYSSLETNNPEMLDTIDAGIFMLIQHVCPEEDLEAVLEICSEFEQNTPAAGGGNFMGLIGNIIGRVTDKLNTADARQLETEDGQINTSAVGGVVTDLMGDKDIQDSMQKMMSSVTGENFDINGVFKNLMNMAGGAKN